MKPLSGTLNSLSVRTLILVVAVTAVAVFTTLSLILRNDQNAHAGQTARFIAGQIRLMQTLLPNLSDEGKQQLAATPPSGQWLQIKPDMADVPQGTAQFMFARDLSHKLTHILNEPITLRQADNEGQRELWIGFKAAGQDWWLILPPPRFKPKGLPHDLWEKLGVSLIVLLIFAALFVRGIVGPLKRLGDAVSATGEGSARKVEPEGPVEVRRLAERHNTMLDQLADADAERREMLAGLTHDLRAPLARLRLRLALLDNEADRQGLSKDSDDMERIVGQCLDFLRTNEQQNAPVESLVIADVVSNEVARHRELGRQIEIQVANDAGAQLVAIRHGNLQRILDNLIGNALQYGEPPIEITLDVERPHMVTLRVRDHGPGIPPDLRKRALDPFTQIEPARATRGSCGLGLAIVRRIVTAAKGEIRLDEATGGGLAVVIHLPTQVAPKQRP